MNDKPFQVGDEVIRIQRTGNIFRGGKSTFFRSHVERITHNGNAIWVDGMRFRRDGTSSQSDSYHRGDREIRHFTQGDWDWFGPVDELAQRAGSVMAANGPNPTWSKEDLRALIALCEKNAAKKE